MFKCLGDNVVDQVIIAWVVVKLSIENKYSVKLLAWIANLE